MFDVTFYTFSKAENSTQRPSGGTTYRCRLKAPCGIVSPVLEIQTEPDFSPAFNYACIPSFGRYYWVREWTNRAGNVWEVPCTVDVLATYRDQIGGASLYIERSSAEYDGELSDTLYPLACNDIQNNITIDWEFAGTFTSGRYILGVVSGGSNALTPLDYFVLAPPQMNSLKSKFYSDLSAWADFGSLADGLAKTIADPIQYVRSLFWVPFVPPAGMTDDRPLNFAFFPGLSSAPLITTASAVYTITKNVVPPRHPLASSRGMYCNVEPFSDYRLHLEPFGILPLDSISVANADSLDLVLKVDLLTGIGILEVWQVKNNARAELITKANSDFAVQIPLAQSSQNILGAIASGASLVSSAYTGNVSGAIASVANVGTSIAPTIQSTGAQGSLSAFRTPSELLCKFRGIAYDDNAHNGRPLGAIRQISAIPGYIEVQKGVVPIPGTQAESEQVRAYLEGGFYYV